MSERYQYIGSAYLFLIKGNQILIQRRFQTGFEDGNYGVPSGHMDGNETAREACAREIKEEIGISVVPNDLSVVHVMHRRAQKDERIDFFMTTASYSGAIENREPDKCDDLRWFNLSELPDNTVDYVRAAIECFKNKITYSEFGY